MSETRSESGRSTRFPHWVWLLFVALYALLVPWWAAFDPSGASLWLGLPRWVVLSYLGSVLVAVVANLVLRRFWPHSTADRSIGEQRG